MDAIHALNLSNKETKYKKDVLQETRHKTYTYVTL